MPPTPPVGNSIFAPVDILGRLIVFKNFDLLVQLTKRDVLGRYRGSIFGVLWSLLSPILMLLVYTFVFGVVFKARWGGAVDDKGQFALIIFSGLLCFNILSESTSRAPSAISGNPNYVKKVVFPVEVIPLSIVFSSVWNAFLSTIVLILGQFMVLGRVPITAL